MTWVALSCVPFVTAYWMHLGYVMIDCILLRHHLRMSKSCKMSRHQTPSVNLNLSVEQFDWRIGKQLSTQTFSWLFWLRLDRCFAARGVCFREKLLWCSFHNEKLTPWSNCGYFVTFKKALVQHVWWMLIATSNPTSWIEEVSFSHSSGYLWSSLEQLDVQSAEASVAADKENILRIVSEGVSWPAMANIFQVSGSASLKDFDGNAPLVLQWWRNSQGHSSFMQRFKPLARLVSTI